MVKAGNGSEGLQQLTNTGDPFRLVTVDMTMPVMGGEEVVAELQRQGSQVPILAISGYGETEAVQRLIGEGVTRFLNKPFTAEGLATAVRRTLI